MKRLLIMFIIVSFVSAGCAAPPPTVVVTLPPAVDTIAPQPTDVPTQPPLTSAATHTHTAEPATQASSSNNIATATNSPTEAPTLAPTDAPTQPPTQAPTQAPTATLGTVFITYQDFQIVPAQVTIPVGTTVVFLIKGGFLSFHQPYNFNAPDTFEAPSGLGDGKSWAYTFNEPGTVTIRCGYHSEMVATITVTP